MRVVAVLPRPAAEVEEVLLSLWRRQWFTFCVCLSSTEEDRLAYRRLAERRGVDVLIVRQSSWNPSEAMTVIEADLKSSKVKGEAAAVIIFDGPDCGGYREKSRALWNEELARLCAEAMTDVQIFEYSSSWKQAPPRIR